MEESVLMKNVLVIDREQEGAEVVLVYVILIIDRK